MQGYLVKISKILRYIGLTVAIVTCLNVMFMLVMNRKLDESRLLYYSFLPFILLYAQVWHLTRESVRNVDSTILAHFIAILYFVGVLLFIWN